MLSAVLPGATAHANQPDRPVPDILFLVIDRDDDNDDGITDCEQQHGLPSDDLVPIPTAWLQSATSAQVKGVEARLVVGGEPTDRLVGAELETTPALQGLRAGRTTLVVTRDGRPVAYALEVIAIDFLDGHNRVLVPAQQDVAVSLHVTNSGSLPPAHDLSGPSGDPRNLRIELTGPSLAGSRQSASLAPVTAARHAAVPSVALPLRLKRRDPRRPFRSPFIRLVADATDQRAPGVRGRVLQVALRDRLRATWNSPTGPLSQDIRVGMRKPGQFAHSAYRGVIRLTVLRTEAQGPPVVGTGDLGALSILREQLETTNQIWAQCGVTFGPVHELDARVVPPPPPALMSVGDGNGLPARGDGVVSFFADGRIIGPLPTGRNKPPVDTALAIAEALQTAGFKVEVTQNPRTQYGVHPSADLLVHNPAGELASLGPIDDTPLSTDSRQRIVIGGVDLSDGLAEFDNMNARAGTLEERSLVKALADRDPTTIDIFIVNYFRGGTRQGEAFIEASGGPLVNVIVLDRNGLKQRDSAFTMAHEIGHVLLDQPLHPDNIGPDRPWLLMDADSSRGTVYGPKRLTENDCKQVVYVSGPGAQPALLRPWQVAP